MKKYILLGAVLVTISCISLGIFLIYRSNEVLDAGLSCDNQTEVCSFTDESPEEIFQKYVWSPIPEEISQLQGVEGKVAFSKGPAFVKFNATDAFIDELVKSKYDNFEAFTSAPCTIFDNILQHHKLIHDFPEKFIWWNTAEVTSPVCFSAYGHQSDDSRHLLVDFDQGIVYFYRTATCGLCPD